MGGLMVAAVAAAMTSSIYPVMIAPPENKRAAKASTGTGFRRSGMWESVDREAKS